MTHHEAKQILSLYRPGTADEEDVTFAEALALCEQDAELKRWFDDHCAVYSSLRSKLREIHPPEGFREQILAERKVNMPGFWNQNRVRVFAAGLAVAVAAMLLVIQRWEPRENTGFVGFRERMISRALRSYGMDLETDNPEQARALFAERKTISDYTLPAGLEKAKLIGCMATTWQGKPVSVLCYHTGKRLPPAQASDLWLFVTETTSVPGAPENPQPTMQQITPEVAAANWTQAGKTYVLAVEGDETSLRKYL